MIAAIMCGGRASRMQQQFINTEKSLLKLNGKTMVELVLNALVQSKKFTRILAITSPNAPATTAYLESNLSQEIEILETSGKSYSLDVSQVLNAFNPSTIFVVTADLPLLDRKDVKKIVLRCGNEYSCTSIVSAKRFVIGLGITPSVIVCINSKEYCHTGISVIDSSRVHGAVSVPEHYVIMNQRGIAVNVNTWNDLEVAKRIMKHNT